MSKIEDALRKFREEQAQSLARQSGSESNAKAIPTRRGQGDIARLEPTERWSTEALEARRLIDFSRADRRVSNAFRQLRTALLQRTANANFILAVTGVSPKSGASFVARNLSAAFALDPTKTAVLVDCNLAASGLPPLTVDDGVPGLADFLLDEDVEVEHIIHPTGLPRLRVIPSGRNGHRADELFTTPRVETLLSQLRQRYIDRFTLLDIPPITESADAGILTQLCDYVLLVIPYGRVSGGQVSDAIDAIGEKRLIGTVFDNEPVWPY